MVRSRSIAARALGTRFLNVSETTRTFSKPTSRIRRVAISGFAGSIEGRRWATSDIGLPSRLCSANAGPGALTLYLLKTFAKVFSAGESLGPSQKVRRPQGLKTLHHSFRAAMGSTALSGIPKHEMRASKNSPGSRREER